jgi:phospholipase/lecithinase/hemolysin
MYPQRQSRRLARVLIALAAFVQFMGVVQACADLEFKVSMAFQSQDCHKPSNPNHCLQQCTAADQSSAVVQIALPGAMEVSVLQLPNLPAAGRSRIYAENGIPKAHDPPPTLRFCTFLL